jgi:peptidoglycan/LPS O-acetylase OafA/YrhL
MSSSKNIPLRLTELDGLRGVMAIFVVFYHLDDTNFISLINDSFLVRNSGYFVDFFFVMSGFVICLNYETKVLSVKHFMIKRLKRLYPMLFFSTTLYLLFKIIVWLFTSDIVSTSKPFIQSYLNTVLLLNSTSLLSEKIAEHGMNFPTWSISGEMFSYLIFALITKYFRGITQPIIVLFSLLASSIILFKMNAYLDPNISFIRAWICFSSGYFVFKINRKSNIKTSSLVAIVMILGLFFLLDHTESPMLELLLVPTIFSAALFFIINDKGRLPKILKNKVFSFLGSISYSLYVNHALFLAVIPYVFFNVTNLQRNLTTLFLCGITIVITSIAWSVLTRKYVENILKKQRASHEN